ncbi:MAG: hypothetical protein ACXAD7_09130 [Candidatus Kariarchaeaceae archaeon]|jgi:hypothetical protein
MSKLEDPKKDHTTEYMEALFDIDIIDMFIIQNLMRYPNSDLLAIDLKKQLDATLPVKNKIYTSKFYNKLRKLKELGFLNFQQIDKKIQSIEATQKAAFAMAEIRTISLFATSQFPDLVEEMIPIYLNHLNINFDGSPIYDNVLLISLEHGKDLRVFEKLIQFGKSTYLVNIHHDDEFPINDVSVRLLEQKEGTIFIPDGFFDAVIMIGFDCNSVSVEDNINWIKETYRLLKPEGILHVSSLSELKKTNHFLIDSFIDELHDNPLFRHVSIDELQNFIDKVGFYDTGIFEYKGMVLGYGKKPVE